MIALIRKNLRLWGYGKSLALFTGCILFSISGRLNGGIAYERHILSAVSDHYYLTYFVLPIVLLSCFSFIDDDGEPVILRFQSYHSYFLKKWIGVGLIAVILTAVQTGAILLSGIGLPLGNECCPAHNERKGTMKHSTYTSYDELPLMLSVAEVAAVLGISRAGAYELVHGNGFPALKIGSRIVVPRDKFLAWIDANSGSKTAPL